MERDFLLLVIAGKSSAYSIWSFIKNEAKLKGLDNVNLKVTSYNNVNKRVTNLIDDGLLEEMKTADASQHGRKDLKLTVKGFMYLVPYIMDQSNPEHDNLVKAMIEYSSKFMMDKVLFEKLLTERIYYSLDFIDFFLTTMKNNPQLSVAYSTKATNQIQRVKKELEALLEIEKVRITREPKLITVRPHDTVESSDKVLADHRPESEGKEEQERLSAIPKPGKHSKIKK